MSLSTWLAPLCACLLPLLGALGHSTSQVPLPTNGLEYLDELREEWKAFKRDQEEAREAMSLSIARNSEKIAITEGTLTLLLNQFDRLRKVEILRDAVGKFELALGEDQLGLNEEIQSINSERLTKSQELLASLQTEMEKLDHDHQSQNDQLDHADVEQLQTTSKIQDDFRIMQSSIFKNTEIISRCEEGIKGLQAQTDQLSQHLQEQEKKIAEEAERTDKLQAFTRDQKGINQAIQLSITNGSERISECEKDLRRAREQTDSLIQTVKNVENQQAFEARKVQKFEAASDTQAKMNEKMKLALIGNSEITQKAQQNFSILESRINTLKERYRHLESRIPQTKAENVQVEATFDESQDYPGRIKFTPSFVTFSEVAAEVQKDRAIVLRPTVVDDLSGNCGSSQWKEDASTGKCYKLVSQKLSWSDANKRCQMEGGQLLSLQSPEEQEFITDWGAKQKSWRWGAWVGGRRIQGQFTSRNGTGWEWFDGSPFEFLNWRDNEPNNQWRGAENCLEIRHDGRWNDRHCKDKLSSICEKSGIFADGVFTAPITGVYKLSFTAWSSSASQQNASVVHIRNNNRIIARTSSDSMGLFGIRFMEELKTGDKVAVFLFQGAIGGESDRSAKFYGNLVQRG